MTSNFKANKGGSYSRPQLSPEEYKEKKRAEKEAVYQMLDDTAAEVVQSPEKFKGYLDVQSRMDRYTANNALLISSFHRQVRSKNLTIGFPRV